MGKKSDKEAAVEVIPEKSFSDEALLEISKNIAKAFRVFDSLGNDTCDVREIGTVFRSLNVYPSEEQLKGWIIELEDDEPTGYIHFAKFNALALKVITSNIVKRANEEELYRAFLTLDMDKRGYLLPEELRNFLQNDGEKFSDEEMEEMLLTCTDPTEGKIFYEDFVVMLVK
ncbi:Dynein regulatory complex protein 8 [Clydaea vesicula]|uniref:Dynein regulatory complex protein 8 n=1 Tax=Clydaea vesicula TaxID=447962 RepID=A0AAD5UAX0_9FUNG|nr:Dynein regulatory complex protein 8 [Clydaea vesicula]KAJ3390741.1 Dynein regulatory complex protein 8 [Lobulomyces angularis]